MYWDWGMNERTIYFNSYKRSAEWNPIRYSQRRFNKSTICRYSWFFFCHKFISLNGLREAAFIDKSGRVTVITFNSDNIDSLLLALESPDIIAAFPGTRLDLYNIESNLLYLKTLI